jgi:ADP-heptose:LPS heptosyltransferase
LPHRSRILIIRLRLLGDVVLLTPAIEALHAWRPDLRISVLVEPSFRALLDGNPAIDEVLVTGGKIATALELRCEKFPIVFNQHAGPSSALLTAVSGAPARVCWVNKQFSWAYNVEVPEADFFYGTAPVHTVEHRMTQFYFTGLPRRPIPHARVYPQSEAQAAVQRKLGACHIDAGQPYAVLRPGASGAAKRWPVERFAEMARQLRELFHVVPVINLGPGDGAVADEVQSLCAPYAQVLSGFTLSELIALIAGARLFIGNDTGPTHIAAATGRPVLAFFGASNATRWRPWATPYRLLQDTSASEAGILSVSVAEAAEACRALLGAAN